MPQVDLQKIIPQGWLPDAWADKLGHAALPLRVVDIDGKGQQALKLEVTRIDKKTLPDSAIAVPQGYKVLHLPMLAGFPFMGP